ncbi:hypothetical protein ACTUSX_23215 [Pantoea ananatis]|uniref:hypothetical protein n=1 Tax=Pantoea ananas TaxID=553 RepID=UPI003FA42038
MRASFMEQCGAEHRQIIAMKLLDTVLTQRLQPAFSYGATNLKLKCCLAQQQELGA